MPLPALPATPDSRSISERVNRLITDFNMRTNAVTVANLPAEVAEGTQALVSDANATTFNSVVAGGGANVVSVRRVGADWRIC